MKRKYIHPQIHDDDNVLDYPSPQHDYGIQHMNAEFTALAPGFVARGNVGQVDFMEGSGACQEAAAAEPLVRGEVYDNFLFHCFYKTFLQTPDDFFLILTDLLGFTDRDLLVGRPGGSFDRMYHRPKVSEKGAFIIFLAGEEDDGASHPPGQEGFEYEGHRITELLECLPDHVMSYSVDNDGLMLFAGRLYAELTHTDMQTICTLPLPPDYRRYAYFFIPSYETFPPVLKMARPDMVAHVTHRTSVLLPSGELFPAVIPVDTSGSRKSRRKRGRGSSGPAPKVSWGASVTRSGQEGAEPRPAPDPGARRRRLDQEEEKIAAGKPGRIRKDSLLIRILVFAAVVILLILAMRFFGSVSCTGTQSC